MDEAYKQLNTEKPHGFTLNELKTMLELLDFSSSVRLQSYAELALQYKLRKLVENETKAVK